MNHTERKEELEDEIKKYQALLDEQEEIESLEFDLQTIKDNLKDT